MNGSPGAATEYEDPREVVWEEIREASAAGVTSYTESFVTYLLASGTDYEVPVDPASLNDCESCQ